MHQLIFQGAKYSFFLLFALSLPILLETKTILHLWLKIVPEYTVIFTQLIIINILIDSISGPLMTAAQASGKIKLYQGIVGGLLILNLPVSYLFLKFGYPPEITLYVSIVIAVIALYARLRIISPLVNLNIFEYLRKVVVRIIPTIIVAIIVPILIIYNLKEGFFRLLISVFFSLVFVGISIYFIGLGKKEQLFIKSKMKYIFEKLKNP